MRVYHGYFLVVDYEQSLFSSLYFSPLYDGLSIYSEHFSCKMKTYTSLRFSQVVELSISICVKKNAKQTALFGYIASISQLSFLLLLYVWWITFYRKNTSAINLVKGR